MKTSHVQPQQNNKSIRAVGIGDSLFMIQTDLVHWIHGNHPWIREWEDKVICIALCDSCDEGFVVDEAEISEETCLSC